MISMVPTAAVRPSDRLVVVTPTTAMKSGATSADCRTESAAEPVRAMRANCASISAWLRLSISANLRLVVRFLVNSSLRLPEYRGSPLLPGTTANLMRSSCCDFCKTYTLTTADAE
jgi:hypothetical protein